MTVAKRNPDIIQNEGIGFIRGRGGNHRTVRRNAERELTKCPEYGNTVPPSYSKRWDDHVKAEEAKKLLRTAQLASRLTTAECSDDEVYLPPAPPQQQQQSGMKRSGNFRRRGRGGNGKRARVDQQLQQPPTTERMMRMATATNLEEGETEEESDEE